MYRSCENRPKSELLIYVIFINALTIMAKINFRIFKQKKTFFFLFKFNIDIQRWINGTRFFLPFRVCIISVVIGCNQWSSCCEMNRKNNDYNMLWYFFFTYAFYLTVSIEFSWFTYAAIAVIGILTVWTDIITWSCNSIGSHEFDLVFKIFWITKMFFYRICTIYFVWHLIDTTDVYLNMS